MAKNNDFNAPQIVKAIDDHGKDIEALEKRIADLENKFGSTENIVKTLSFHLNESNAISEILSLKFQKLLSTDEKIKENITIMVDKIDRTKWKIFLGKSWTAITLGSGFLIKALIDKFIK